MARDRTGPTRERSSTAKATKPGDSGTGHLHGRSGSAYNRAVPTRASREVALLFSTRSVRLFAYGFLAVVLVLYLSEAGLSEGRIGLLLSLTLLGDTALSLWITTHADRIGRRRMLLVGAAMMVLAGVLFVATTSFWLLLLAATIGIIS